MTRAELVKKLMDAGANSDIVALFIEAAEEVGKAEAEKMAAALASLEKKMAREAKAERRRRDRKATIRAVR